MRQAEPFDKILAVVATLVVLTAASETALSHESKIASEPKFCIESKKLCDEGNVFLARGQFSEAEPYFQKALTLSPNYGRAWRELGVVLGKKGKKSAEIKAYEKAVSCDPTDIIAHYDLGFACANAGEPAAAQSAYKKALSCVPANSVGWIALAYCQLYSGKLELADASVQKALKLKPDDAQALTLYSQILLIAKHYSEAEVICRKSLKLAPLRGHSWEFLGLILDYRDKLKEAVQAYKKAIALEPNNFNALVLLGAAQERLGEHSSALDNLNRGLKIKPEDAATLFCSGLAAMRLGQQSLAENYFSRAQKIEPTNVAVLMGQAELAAQMKQDNLAIARYQKILSLDPKRLDASSKLANLFLKNGRPLDAEKIVSDSCRINKLNAEAWASRADILRQTGKLIEAKADILKALKSAPKVDRYLVCLGKIRSALNDNNGACEALVKATQLNPLSVDAWSELAYNLTQAGKGKSAEIAVKRALALEPNNARLWLLDGDIARLRNSSAEAEASYLHALRLRPHYSFALAQLGELLLQQKRFPEAIVRLREATAIDSELGKAWFNLGKAYDASGAEKEARAAYDRAAKAKSNSKSNLLEIAFKLDQGGDINGATKAYKTGLMSRTEDTDVLLEVVYGMRERAYSQ